jgi:hypothetical protein
MVAPPLFELTPDRDDPLKQPTRGGLMPVVLSEVGSITLRSEHDLLGSAEGQAAVAAGLLDGLAEYFGERQLAARIDLDADDVGERPLPVAGDGPPFMAPVAPDGPIDLRVTNTGIFDWPSNVELIAGWDISADPYLSRPPEALEPLEGDVPALAPGESVVISVELPPPPRDRALAWISLWGNGATTADRGSPALQLSSQSP